MQENKNLKNNSIVTISGLKWVISSCEPIKNPILTRIKNTNLQIVTLLISNIHECFHSISLTHWHSSEDKIADKKGLTDKRNTEEVFLK